jgi:hypothetical protein
MEKTVAAHLSKHDREIASIRKLLLARMKMLAQSQKAGKETDRRIDRLVGEGEVMRAELRQIAAEGGKPGGTSSA